MLFPSELIPWIIRQAKVIPTIETNKKNITMDKGFKNSSLKFFMKYKIYNEVCEWSKTWEGREKNATTYWVEILSKDWRLHFLANLHEKYLKLYQNCRKNNLKEHRSMNAPWKRIPTHCEPTSARSENKVGRPSTLLDFSCYHSVE